jgi:hypothetical protein
MKRDGVAYLSSAQGYDLFVDIRCIAVAQRGLSVLRACNHTAVVAASRVACNCTTWRLPLQCMFTDSRATATLQDRSDSP